MTTTTEPFTLSDFIGCDKSRPLLLKPWKRGGHVFATDGRIAVRTDAVLFPEVQLEQDAKLQIRIDELLSETLPDTDWVMPPAVMLDVKPIQCNDCKGGIATCPHCNRSGPCENCDGTGFYTPHTGIDVGKVRLNMFYVDKLNRLPGVMIHLPPDRDPLLPVRFRFNHGIGVLMPMNAA